MNPPRTVLHRLMGVIEARKKERPAGSYTTLLLDGGKQRIAAKVREEAEELIEAATDMTCTSPKFVIHEAADLVYHMLVLLAECGVSFTQVEAELEDRFGISGLDEKAARRGAEARRPPRKG